MAICDHCEGLSPESSKYCIVCGSPMPGIAQIETGRIANRNGRACRKCSAGNPERSVFCGNCGHYLRWRSSLAIPLLLASAVIFIGLLTGMLWWLLVIALVTLEGTYWAYIAFFGINSGKPYWQWKARRQLKREMKLQSVPSEKRP